MELPKERLINYFIILGLKNFEIQKNLDREEGN